MLGKGMVAGVMMVDPDTGEPDGQLASALRGRAAVCGKRPFLMFSPVGKMGGTVKIAPPLNLTREACDDSLTAFREAVSEAIAERTKPRNGRSARGFLVTLGAALVSISSCGGTAIQVKTF
ncbi:MAG: hypothetical protein R2748_23120 [Bryobacterales bacterium]